MSKNEAPTWELAWDDWVSIGKAFKKLNVFLTKAVVNTKPKTGERAKKLRRMEEAFNRLQSDLDDLVCSKFTKEKGANAAMSVFYGEESPILISSHRTQKRSNNQCLRPKPETTKTI